MSEDELLKQYFEEMGMDWDLEHLDEYSEKDKQHWMDSVGFNKWRAVKQFKDAMRDEILPYFEPLLEYLSKKLN